MISLFVFFFKQKTAYDMRISDWSSDVCSSDLYTTAPSGNPLAMSPASTTPAGGSQPHDNLMPTLAVQFCIATSGIFPSRGWRAFRRCKGLIMTEPFIGEIQLFGFNFAPRGWAYRSEEHTSELQSLLHISYAVF